MHAQSKAGADQAVQTEEPAVPAVFHGDVYDQKIDTFMKQAGRYLLAQPALLLTGSYLFCSLLGLIFVVSLFDKFAFAVLPYLEISDFLLAALSHPWTLVLLLLWTAGILLITWLDRLARQRFRRYARFSDRFYQPQYQRPSLMMFACLPLLFLINAALAEANTVASAVKAGSTTKFELSLIYPLQDKGKTLHLAQAQIIARSVSYLFVYHQQQIKVIPHANVAALIPQSIPAKAAQTAITPAVTTRTPKPH